MINPKLIDSDKVQERIGKCIRYHYNNTLGYKNNNTSNTNSTYKCNKEYIQECIDKSNRVYGTKSIDELHELDIEETRVLDRKYSSNLFISLGLILITLFCLLGCSTTYIDTDSSEQQAKTISAVLSECVEQPKGTVGNTNMSLAKAYMRSTESLVMCQEISKGVIDGLNNLHKE
ncbi:MAG: hypothetical protein ACRC9P_06835 [Bacteroides sp.]